MSDDNIISLEKEKEIGLDILKAFDSLCKCHSLKYYLCYGTLIGAVRHRGFIPWDDDIDVVMFREDYDELLLHSSELPSNYCCLSFEDGTFYLPYTKIVDANTRIISDGVNIDIRIGIDVFPLDFLGNSQDIAQKIKKRTFIYEKMMRYSLYNSLKEVNSSYFDFTRSVFYFISKFMGWKNSARLYRRKRNKLVSDIPTRYVGVFASFNNSVIPTMDINDFEKTIFLDFEGIEFPCPSGYDHLLTGIYGDYMKLPPEKMRIPHAHRAYYV